MAGALLGHAAPFISAVAQAAAAAPRIFATIERPSVIDPMSDAGVRLSQADGEIAFQNLKFVYPSRPNQVIFENLDLEISAGKTVAIVGPSGSGKTTLFSLLERLYLPVHGQITLDGHPIEELNLSWLRSQIGLVAQDNFIFNTTIYENIAYGLGPQYGSVSTPIVSKPMLLMGTDNDAARSRQGGPADRGSSHSRQRPCIYHVAFRWLPNHRRRTRLPPVRRPKAAPGNCPSHHLQSAHPSAR